MIIEKLRPFLRYLEFSPFLNSMQRNKASASTQSNFESNEVLPTDSITCSIFIWSSRSTLIITSSFDMSSSATTSQLIFGLHVIVSFRTILKRQKIPQRDSFNLLSVIQFICCNRETFNLTEVIYYKVWNTFFQINKNHSVLSILSV